MNDERRPLRNDSDHRRLVRAAVRLLGQADAEDAVQDAYVRALEAAMLEHDAARAWLVTVGRNLAIDRLRRRQWMQQWLAQEGVDNEVPASPSPEDAAALAQQTTNALRLLAAHLTPPHGALVLLHEVFDVGHAEIARAGGWSEAGSRQQLRRALARLRRADGTAGGRPGPELEPSEEVLLRLYLRSVQLRDPQPLWAMLCPPPIRALSGLPAAASKAVVAPPMATSTVVQGDGHLGLAVMLDGVTLCVLPLGVLGERDPARQG